MASSYSQVGDTVYYVADNGQSYPIDGQGRPYDPTSQLFLGTPEATQMGLPTFNTATPNTLQTATPEAANGIGLPNYMAQTITDPQLVNGTAFVPTLADTSTTGLQSTGQLMTNNPATQIAAQTPVVAPAPIVAQTGTAAQVNPAAAQALVNPTAATYTPTLVGNNTPQATAQQGEVSASSLVAEQLKKLYAESQPGMIPDWAKGAVVKANELMAARGLGASSIGVAATAAAMQASALPIAAQDAATYFQMDLRNLDNRQQTELANLQVRQQAMLSDQAASNASSQFNAASESQTQQFMATLVTNIQQQNADRLTAMSQFNAGQANQTEQFNATQKSTIDQFNSQISYARDQFNAQAAFAIEQSNVTWRRSLNTANTAAINAANQTNVQNRFNMSQQAQNNLWQQWRDEAAMAWQSAEASVARAAQGAQSANNNTPEGFNIAKAAGAFISGLLF